MVSGLWWASDGGVWCQVHGGGVLGMCGVRPVVQEWWYQACGGVFGVVCGVRPVVGQCWWCVVVWLCGCGTIQQFCFIAVYCPRR